jgi:hypothetical protein
VKSGHDVDVEQRYDPAWHEWTRSEPYSVGIEEAVMLLEPEGWELSQASGGSTRTCAAWASRSARPARIPSRDEDLGAVVADLADSYAPSGVAV